MAELKNFSILLIGNGHVAQHLGYYLKLKNIPFQTWNRKQPSSDLELRLKWATHVWLAVSDAAIEDLSKLALKGQLWVHFSGRVVCDQTLALHPLMTFGDELYDLETYQSIPFVADRELGALNPLPGLKNPIQFVEPRLRSLYHAYCSLTNNLTYLLWQELQERFSLDLALPRESLEPIILQTAKNAVASNNRFTGPVSRREWATVTEHLKALSEKPELQDMYLAYLNLARKRGYQSAEVTL